MGYKMQADIPLGNIKSKTQYANSCTHQLKCERRGRCLRRYFAILFLRPNFLVRGLPWIDRLSRLREQLPFTVSALQDQGLNPGSIDC